MNSLGPPSRSSEPLHAMVMAVALVIAAILGAGLGFLLDSGDSGDDSAAVATAGEADQKAGD